MSIDYTIDSSNDADVYVNPFYLDKSKVNEYKGNSKSDLFTDVKKFLEQKFIEEGIPLLDDFCYFEWVSTQILHEEGNGKKEWEVRYSIRNFYHNEESDLSITEIEIVLGRTVNDGITTTLLIKGRTPKNMSHDFNLFSCSVNTDYPSAETGRVKRSVGILKNLLEKDEDNEDNQYLRNLIVEILKIMEVDNYSSTVESWEFLESEIQKKGIDVLYYENLF